MRIAALILGCAIWLAAIAAVGGSMYTVCCRILRPVATVRIAAPEGHGLTTGDTVFLATESGWQRIGEVDSVRPETIALAIEPAMADKLDGASPICGRTPLSAEETVSTLLPADIQNQVANIFSQTWRDRGDELTEIWKPIAAELATSYLELIGDELKLSIQSHRSDIRTIGMKHLRDARKDWPEIQRRLRPILQTHLTPVLGRLTSKAFDEAPKAGILWNAAQGDFDLAYEQLLDWLGEYIANLPEDDRRELGEAVAATWEAAKQDRELGDCLKRMAKRLSEDKELGQLTREIWRETIAENPRTADFLRQKIVDDPHIRREVYRTVELLGPAMKSVLAAILFDKSGVTRPEVVHFVRSAALGRKMAWVTFHQKSEGSQP